MKIVKVDILQFNCNTNVPFRPIGCRIYTDEGIYGDGEAALSYGTGGSGSIGVIKDLSGMLIGLNPLNIEPIWNSFHKSTFWGQCPGPVFYAAVSAIDMALWDIKGKFFGVPVYCLLGGKFRDSLRCYASQIQSGFGPVHVTKITPEDYAAISKQVVAEGYDALKIDFMVFDEKGQRINPERKKGPLKYDVLHMIEERLAAVRDAVGPAVDIIIENHSHPDATAAVQIGKMAEKYNVYFFEEPNTPSPKTAKYISDNMSIPIANGERIFTRWQYAPYFENMSIQIAQPDIGTCGGFTEAKKICDMAHAYDVTIQAHACGTPLSSTAALHLETAIPNFIIHEHHLCFLHDYNRELCVNDYQPVNGSISAPELPGLGNEWSETAMANADKITVK